MTDFLRQAQEVLLGDGKMDEPSAQPSRSSASNPPAAVVPPFDLESASWDEQMAHATKLTNQAEAIHQDALGKLREADKIWRHVAQSARAGEVKQVLASKAIALGEATAAAQRRAIHDAGPAKSLGSIFLELPAGDALDDESSEFEFVDSDLADDFETLSPRG